MISKVFGIAVALLTVGTALAQEPANLKKTANGKAHEHGPSKCQFTPPEGWKVDDPENLGQSSVLALRWIESKEAEPGIEVTVFWSPLNVTLEEAANIERDLLTALYGKDKVSQVEQATAGMKTGSKITVADGPSRNNKEMGIVYLFETGSGERRWKIKIRATMPKAEQATQLKRTDELLKGIKF